MEALAKKMWCQDGDEEKERERERESEVQEIARYSTEMYRVSAKSF